MVTETVTETKWETQSAQEQAAPAPVPPTAASAAPDPAPSPDPTPAQRPQRIAEFPGPPEACQEVGGKGEFVRSVLERIGDKWSLMIIGSLHQGPLRFTALLQEIGGISQRMLTLNLRHLERDGLISRTVYAEVPPRVEYQLTELGHSLLVPVLDLVNWAADHADRIETKREAYDAALDGDS